MGKPSGQLKRERTFDFEYTTSGQPYEPMGGYRKRNTFADASDDYIISRQIDIRIRITVRRTLIL